MVLENICRKEGGMKLADLVPISKYEWEIPRGYRDDMRVAVRLFATEEILEAALLDNTLQQAINAATLPGLAAPILVMPDMHEGYGFPIGGVGLTRLDDGVISPGGIGYDINCGVRLLASSVHAEEAKDALDALATAINQYCPSGVGGKGVVKLTSKGLEEVCHEGLLWAKKNGYATESDIRRTEDRGCLDGADMGKVSQRAKERGLPQLGSLGAGNHFIEVDVVEQIFDEKAAAVMGLQKGCLAVQIHSGSRGLGHQICTDYVQQFQSAVRRYGIQLPDRELVCAPINSPEGESYLAAMRAAANYAYVNRQVLAHLVRQAFEKVLAGKCLIGSCIWCMILPIIWGKLKPIF
jgi:tRNA-splicing ligase RtcB